jgi:enterochelin esterase-like enzyme
MKKATRSCLLVFTFFLTAAGLRAQTTGRVIEQLHMESKILGKAVHYTVYLPGDYQSSQRSYPVLYLLHGYTDDNTAWLQFGEINRLADQAIAEGSIPPMIIIMPNADSSFYINSYDGKENYEDFFIKEFMPSVEKEFRIKSQKRYRAVAGLSMGGYGTLIYALKYPQLFAAAAPLSAAVFNDDAMTSMPASQWDDLFGQLFGRGLQGKDRLNNAYRTNSILDLVKNNAAEKLKTVRYWIDCGDDDFLSKGNCLLHIALAEKGIPHEFRVRDGAHTWSYWRSGIIPALQFIGQSFHQ